MKGGPRHSWEDGGEANASPIPSRTVMVAVKRCVKCGLEKAIDPGTKSLPIFRAKGATKWTGFIGGYSGGPCPGKKAPSASARAPRVTRKGPRKKETAACPCCKRQIATYIPRGGDGSLLLLRKHLCVGGVMAVRTEAR